MTKLKLTTVLPQEACFLPVEIQEIYEWQKIKSFFFFSYTLFLTNHLEHTRQRGAFESKMTERISTDARV